MKNLLTLLVLGSTISFNTAAKPRQSVTEHFWRDYNGLIPNDAIIAGKTLDGENTYIGQMTTKSDDFSFIQYIPGTIRRGKISVEAAYRGSVVDSNNNSNAKILCSQYPTRYKWHTNSTIAPDCYYVVVGQENMYALHFAQVKYSNQTLNGKVFAGDTEFAHVPYGNSVLLFENYATLLYCR